MQNTLGEKVRQARLRRQWSIHELHRQSGVAIGTIRRLEANDSRPYDHTLARLANALGVDLSEFVDGRAAS